ncbi:MAG TPA: O-antigen ligase family protein [Candidatus Binataceae bacterium]|nr:O-antigen ligase family protein [Candidatus Binataceae bacterium]
MIRLVFVAGLLGAFVALALYATKVMYVSLLPLGVALFLPALLVKNFRLYWLSILLLTLEFPISKNLNDGLAVVERLQIDYTIWNFTFEVTATDLVLVILVVIWINDALFHRKAFRFPKITWLAVGYLGMALLSTFGAASTYLGMVEIARQIKVLIVYLYAVNCLDSKGFLRVLVILAVTILFTQAAATAIRFETGYLTPLTLGQGHEDLSQIEQYLMVDRSDEGSAVRAFGTLNSPGSTVRLCMMVIPFVMFLCAPNPVVKRRWPFLFCSVFGVLGLSLTFTRVYYVTTAVQVLLVLLMMLRDHKLKREEIITLAVVSVLALGAVSPKLYKQFTVRKDSVSVRFLQYRAATKMIIAHPLLGVGLNNSTGEKSKYSNITYNKYDPESQFDSEPTHNLYLSLTSEIGVIGAALFFTFFAKVTLICWRESYSSDPEIQFLASALFVTFCGVAVNGLMDPLQEYPVLVLLWMYAGLALNLKWIQEQEVSLTQYAPGSGEN